MNNSEKLVGFEGAEKILHIKITSPRVGNGLLSIPQESWSSILTAAKCTILSKISTQNMTAYILSESSLFVTDRECIIKTCGRTVLLLALPLVLNIIKEKGLEVEFILYSSKNFLFPSEQFFPHSTKEDSEYYLQSIFPDEKSLVLGNSQQDHVFLFTYTGIPLSDCPSLLPSFSLSNSITKKEICGIPEPSSPCSVNFSGLCEGGLESCYLNIMMYDMNEQIAQQFYSRPNQTASDVTTQSGIRSIFTNAIIDDFLFEPCGYSMNGLADGGFFTIHITPEQHCSYASFETNIVVHNYTNLIQYVLQIFQPKRFCMTFFYHRDLMAIAEDNPIERKSFVANQSGETYIQIDKSVIEKDHSYYHIGTYSSR